MKHSIYVKNQISHAEVTTRERAVANMLQREQCPIFNHYHVAFGQAGSLKEALKTVIAPSPEDALAYFLPSLPKGWRGGVSVYDDSFTDTDEMPLLHRYVDSNR